MNFINATYGRFGFQSLTSSLITIVGLALPLSLYSLWFFSEKNILVFGDATSHVITSRMIVYSLTPGFSQIGNWGALLHLALLPFTLIDPLFYSNAVAFPVTFPAYLLAAAMAGHLAFRFTKMQIAALVAAVFLVIQPYQLYFSASPMTEGPFICALLFTVLFLEKWKENPIVWNLIKLGIVVAIAGLSRLEGFILVPVIWGYMALYSIHQKRGLSLLAAEVLIFSFVAGTGVVFEYLYTYFYIGKLSLPGSHLHLGYQGFEKAWSISYWAMKEIFGERTLFLALISTFIGFISLKKNPSLAALITPAIGIFVLLVLGKTRVGVYNARYFLSCAPFFALVFSLVVKAFYRPSFAFRFLTYLVSFFLVAIWSEFTYYSFFRDSQFPILTQAYKEVINQRKNSYYKLKKEIDYDGGFILAARQLNQDFLYQSRIPLDRVVSESNHRYFPQVLKEPWLFARWVFFIDDASGQAENYRYYSYVVNRVKLFENFNKFYTKVWSDSQRSVYKLNEKNLIRFANIHDMSTEAIPSLNPNAPVWDPSLIYSEIYKN